MIPTWNTETIERLQALWRDTDYTYRQLAETMSKDFDLEFNFDMIRNYIRRHRELFPPRETVDFIERGLLDTNYTAERTTVMLDGLGNVQKVYVKGLRNVHDDAQTIIDALKSINPMEIVMPPQGLKEPSDSLYVIPLFDMHMGIADYEYYKPTQQNVFDEINQGHKKIIFAIGSDLIHNNDFKGNTANGTPIEAVDVPQAIIDSESFFIPLIRAAIQTEAEVEVLYVLGNHDSMSGWSVVHYLSGIFPQVKFDMEVEERKARLWNGVFVGFTHGDKASNLRDMAEAFINENTQIWSQATVKEVYSGHLHKERVAEHLKTRVRILSTRAITDGWSKDRAFHSVKEFQTFVFKPNKRVRMVTV